MTARAKAVEAIVAWGGIDAVPMRAVAEDVVAVVERAGLRVVGQCGECAHGRTSPRICVGLVHCATFLAHRMPSDGCTNWRPR